MKTCTVCKEPKELDQFYSPRRKRKSGYIIRVYDECKVCFNKLQAKDYEKSKVERRTKKNTRRKENPEKFDKWNRKQLLKQYGMTPEDYDKLFEKQKGLCAICAQPTKRRLSVDHDHSVIPIVARGLLCHPCNTALGLFKEDTTVLQRAIDYLNN